MPFTTRHKNLPSLNLKEIADHRPCRKRHVKSTTIPGASGDLGGFGGGFDLAEAGYKEPPILVTGTDGVGTKLLIAQAMNKHDTIGVSFYPARTRFALSRATSETHIISGL